MKVILLKYPAVFLVITLCFITPALGQEGGFMVPENEKQVPIEALGTQGGESTYQQPKVRTSETKSVVKEGNGNFEQEPTSLDKNVNSTASQQNPIKVEKESAASKASAESANKEDDSESVLSFNFLHYIIHKFKFSDIINQ